MPAPTAFLVQYFPSGSRFIQLRRGDWAGFWRGDWYAPGWEPAKHAALSAPLLRTIFCGYPSIQQRATLEQYGLSLATPCWAFDSYIGPMTVCNLQRGSGGPAAAAAYTMGITVSFAAGGDAPAYMLAGWWPPDKWFAWAVGTEATLVLRLPAEVDKELLVLRAKLIPLYFAPQIQSEVTVIANGREVARWRLEGSPVREYTACIPADTVRADGRLLLKFVNPNPVSPAQLGVNADARQLAFGLQTFEVTADQGGC
jgi:hypothetical protein